MSLEKLLAAVPVQVFTSNGTAAGLVTVADAVPFRVGQQVVVTAVGQTNLELEVKRVLSSTQLTVGPLKSSALAVADLSAFTVASSASILANEQRQPLVTSDEFERAVYEEEPVVAKRVILVDEQGDLVNAANPLPTLIDGVATAANQVVGNSSLSSLDAKVPPLTLAAFGELLTAELITTTAWRFDYGVNNYLITPTTANGGTVTVNQSRAVLSTSTATNGRAKIETRNQLRYTPGVGGLARFTAVFASGTANNQQIIGIGTDSDGFFFGYNGTSFGIMRRRAGVDTWVAQANWNGEALGETLIPQFGNIYQIRYQWLGYGLIKFYVFDKTIGRFALVHTIQYPNTSALTHTLNPTFPLMAENKNTGNSTDVVMYTPSALGALENGHTRINNPDPLAVPRSSDGTATISATTVQHLYSLQNKSIAYTGGLTNHAPMKIASIDISRIATSGTSQIKLWKDITTSVPLVFTDVSTADSPAAVSVTSTLVTSTDSLRTYGMDSTTTTRFINLIDEDFVVYPGETFSISTTNSSVQSTAFIFSINWFELF